MWIINHFFRCVTKISSVLYSHGVPRVVIFDNASLPPGRLRRPEQGKYMHLDSHSLGWRLRVLRLRREMTLAELARLSGLEISYLSRLERDVLQNAKPKPETVDRILDAVDATLEERQSIYHLEHPPLDKCEIEEQIQILFEQQETFPEPVILRDEHWNACYFNLSARTALGLTVKEYRRMLGTNMLHEIIDPAIPAYSRCSDEERETVFSVRA